MTLKRLSEFIVYHDKIDSLDGWTVCRFDDSQWAFFFEPGAEHRARGYCKWMNEKTPGEAISIAPPASC